MKRIMFLERLAKCLNRWSTLLWKFPISRNSPVALHPPLLHKIIDKDLLAENTLFCYMNLAFFVRFQTFVAWWGRKNKNLMLNEFKLLSFILKQSNVRPSGLPIRVQSLYQDVTEPGIKRQHRRRKMTSTCLFWWLSRGVQPMDLEFVFQFFALLFSSKASFRTAFSGHWIEYCLLLSTLMR